MAEEVGAYRKSLSTLSSGVVESLSSASITSWQGAGSAASGSPKMSRLSGTSSSPQSSPDTSASIKPSALLAVAKPFSPQGVRELKIQSQLQPHSEILKQLEMEMSQSPQATILRRMKEESRNEEGNSSAKVLEDERIIKLEKEATARELAYLLAEEVPVTVADMLRALTACVDDLKGDPVEDEGRGEQIVQETLEEQKARLRKKVALNLDSMLKYGSGPKGKEKLNAEDEEKAEDDGLRKGPKLGPRSHLLDLSKKTDEGVTSLRGFAAISGWAIYKSDLRIDVKPTWGKKMPLQLKAQISSLGALRLAQIQNAHNYTRMAIGELSRLQRQMEKTEGRAEARSLIDALQRITDELRMAREELVNGMPEFPDNLFAPTAFLPALPPDIAIEFHVCDSQLVLSIYILQISPVPAKLARESAQQHQGGMLNASGAGVVDLSSAGRGRTKSHMRQTPAVGQSYVVQGKKVEVMDAIRLPCDVPLLKAAVHALEQANDLASDMKDKLLAVST